MCSSELSSSPIDDHEWQWLPQYHVAPPFGLLNDPNGFCYFAGQYWLYFQWNPADCSHQNKHWGLMTSSDLVQWRQQPFKMAPEHWYDKDGCYSGTALMQAGQLSLFYTGNVRHGEIRESYQCLVTSDDGIHYQHHGPLWRSQLAGFTGHVRDPKVFVVDGQKRMWLAAQTDTLQGGIALLIEQADGHWQLQGHYHHPINWANNQLGYMWECPDRVVLDQQTLLLCCIQGIDTGLPDYRNPDLSGYFCVNEDPSSGAISFTSDYRLLDHGFEFYAPQTTQDPVGEIYIIGWMGLPDSAVQPTQDQEGWCHQLTMARHCCWSDNWLWQRPVAATFDLFRCERSEISIVGHLSFHCAAAAYINCLVLTSNGQLVIGNDDAALVIHWDDQGHLSIDRGSLAALGDDTRRDYHSRQGKIGQLQLFLDNSSFELFINDGEAVMSGRLFAKQPLYCGRFEGQADAITIHALVQPVIDRLSKEMWYE
ncbi:sucrose-6-phosphate hydrolase [Celerinatantimonas yamalensis]|uniref:Sucrose-6-phosphate hydrolase n=1 Tax=Celerinatantimonas yamalensis TaxID=559956 RepID=A0ABW9GB29_9GAMM